MEPGNTFNLTDAVSRWRTRLAESKTLVFDELDELEAHLWDTIDARTAAGESDREAFEAAVWQLGHELILESEFQKAHEADEMEKRPFRERILWHVAMLKNYFKIAFRNVRRQPGYAFINVFSLSLGIACCLLLFLYVRDELAFDRFHQNADRIHRLYRITYDEGGGVEENDAHLPLPLGPAIQDDIPEVQQFVRFTDQTHFVRTTDGEAREEEVLYADANVFDVFSFPLRYGDPFTALVDPGGVVLSESAALRYFGDENALGRQLLIRLNATYETFTVTGVAYDVPGNSSIRFHVLLPFSRRIASFDWVRQRVDDWNWSFLQTYVLLSRPIEPSTLAGKLLEFRRKYYPDEAKRLREENRWSGPGDPVTYGLQPITAMHLDPSIPGGQISPSNPMYSYILGGIALAVLLIACINFMTLAVGRSVRRVKEVGIRKVVGAHRRQLMVQFWGEALFLGAFSVVLGLALVFLFLPVFNDLAVKTLRLDLRTVAAIFPLLIALLGFTGFVAGVYPALLLSGFSPIETLKSRLRVGGTNTLTRSLVVVQFALSVFLICSTAIMFNQLEFLRSKDLGFDKEHVVVVPTNGIEGTRTLARLRNELGDETDFAGFTATSASLSRGYSQTGFRYKDELKQVYEYAVDARYVDLMDLELVAGRNFDPNLPTDTTQAVLVNEALVRDFGWTDAVGQELTGYTSDSAATPVVIGVVRDHNFRSLRDEVEPMLLTLNTTMAEDYRHVLVRLRPGDIPAGLNRLEAVWKEIAPDVPFQYSFLDQDLDRQYQSDQRWSRIVAYAAGFAVLIACLGLFGLAALTVVGRTKEIGIRKVLGASVPRITGLLSKEFLRLVLTAVAFAVPISYLVMERWLENFAFRIDVSIWTFVGAGLLAFFVALAAVSYQTVRAALSDPVEALRYE